VGRARPLFVRGIRAAHPDKEVEVWFQDEARLGQQGTLTTTWARKGSRPRAVKQTEYQWVYLSAAVNPETGQALGLITPDMNTLVMNDLLTNLSQMLGSDRHAVLVWDNAGFHTSNSLDVPDNITLLPLPPYAPELNPIERVWRYLRNNHLSNRAYVDRKHLEEAATDACSRLDPQRLGSITRTAWIVRSY
jgi:putative transposase